MCCAATALSLPHVTQLAFSTLQTSRLGTSPMLLWTRSVLWLLISLWHDNGVLLFKFSYNIGEQLEKINLILCLSVSVSVSLSVCGSVSLCLSVCLCVTLCLSLLLCMSFCLSHLYYWRCCCCFLMLHVCRISDDDLCVCLLTLAKQGEIVRIGYGL